MKVPGASSSNSIQAAGCNAGCTSKRCECSTQSHGTAVDSSVLGLTNDTKAVCLSDAREHSIQLFGPAVGGSADKLPTETKTVCLASGVEHPALSSTFIANDSFAVSAMPADEFIALCKKRLHIDISLRMIEFERMAITVHNQLRHSLGLYGVDPPRSYLTFNEVIGNKQYLLDRNKQHAFNEYLRRSGLTLPSFVRYFEANL